MDYVSVSIGSILWEWMMEENYLKVQHFISMKRKNFCFACSLISYKEFFKCREKTLASPLDCKEIQPVHPKGDQSWDFIGRIDAEAETPILWPPHVKSWLIGKDPDAGRDWGQEEKGTTEDEMAGWHHRLSARVWVNSESWWWTGDLACCDSWGHKELDTTERLNWTEEL